MSTVYEAVNDLFATHVDVVLSRMPWVLRRTRTSVKCHVMFVTRTIFFLKVPKHNVATQVFKDSIGIWVGDGANRKGWNRNQQTVNHNRFRGSTCGRLLQEKNFAGRQATLLFYPSPSRTIWVIRKCCKRDTFLFKFSFRTFQGWQDRNLSHCLREMRSDK